MAMLLTDPIFVTKNIHNEWIKYLYKAIYKPMHIYICVCMYINFDNDIGIPKIYTSGKLLL